MKRLLLIVCLAAISLLAGVAIAGRPTSVPNDLVIASPPSPASAPPTTTGQAPGGPTATSSVAPALTAVPSTSTTTSTTVTPTAPPTTPAPTTTLAPMEQIRVVVANATSSPGLAADHAEELQPFGYTTTATDSTLPIEVTTVYFADGFRPEAIRLAEQLAVSLDAVQPRLAEPMTVDDADGDLWLVLAPDRAP